MTVLEIIKQIEAEKQAQNRAPTHVTLCELNQAIRGELNRLYKAGKIHVGDTINDKFLKSI